MGTPVRPCLPRTLRYLIVPCGLERSGSPAGLNAECSRRGDMLQVRRHRRPNRLMPRVRSLASGDIKVSGSGLSVMIGHRRQHFWGSVAWTAGDLLGGTRKLQGRTCPGQQRRPRPLPALVTRQISMVVNSGRVTKFPGNNLAWSDHVGSVVIDIPPERGFCGRIKLRHQHFIRLKI
ncbi:hypothetical protein TIFTF001_045861 [Ficus carica]|uniref:Uncharacterized protein n=1 Tax=Ficus carica TaxID=3494 RepID=A0AA87YVC3_FICCA|nr:hypothetical protein TIFTF001_045861 [Ficus carica]